MNKKLVAIAVASVAGLPMAAQAQTANVTLYGRLNLTYEFVKGAQPNGSNPTIHRLSSNSSRLGVRGEENLGGGLKALFQIESSIGGDAGGGTLAGRDTFIGLQGGWGTVRIGNFLAPYDDVHPVFGNGPTYLTSIMSTAALWANGALGRTTGGFDNRYGNSVRYDSPTMGGFNGGIHYSTAENADKAYTLSMAGKYTGGPFQGIIAWERHDEERGTNSKDDAFSIAGNFTFGMGTVAAVWERIDYEGAGADFKRDFWGISGTFKAGPGRLYAFYGESGKNKGSGSIGAILRAGDNTKAKQYEVSYTYDLSKRTSVYAGYVRIQNESRANYSFNINPYLVTQGGDPQGIVFGVIHLF